MFKKTIAKVTAYAVTFGLVGGATFQGVNYASNKWVNKSTVESSANTTKVAATTTVDNSSSSTGSGVSTVASNVLPSIVAINVTVTSTASDIFGRTTQQDETGSGSGIIVAEDDKYVYIATNNHVVADATKVSVKFNDESVYDAQVKGTDSDSDLAVVQVDASKVTSATKKNIKVATLGNSTQVKVGAQAIAIGNALGYGTSVTVGYISAKDRTVSSEDVTMKLLQTDAAINPGNSGGALVDENGKVIGINSAKYSDTSVEGMGFAIPISTAIPIINEIVKSESVSEDQQAYLGLKGTDVSSEYAQYYNMPEGIYVADVTANSPVSKAGMKKGDIIVKFNGSSVSSMEGLQEKLGRCKAGDKATITVKRADNGSYKTVKLSVTLGSKADAPQSTDRNSNDSNSNSNSGNSAYGSNNSNYNYGSSSQNIY